MRVFLPTYPLGKWARTTVFLDRDGVLNRRVPDGYVTRWSEFVFLPGVKAALRQLRRAGFLLVIVSNQAGVATGHLSRKGLIVITTRCLRELAASGCAVDAAFYCLHHASEGCRCRKPAIGLFREAARVLPITLAHSYLVGDSSSDIAAGTKIGCRTIYITSAVRRARSASPSANYLARNLRQAVRWILAQELKTSSQR